MVALVSSHAEILRTVPGTDVEIASLNELAEIGDCVLLRTVGGDGCSQFDLTYLKILPVRRSTDV